MVILLIGWGTEPKRPSANERNPTSEHYGGKYEGRVTCEADCQVTFGLSPDSVSDGEHQESNTANKRASDNALTVGEADLLAQEKMAHWTKVIGVMTAVGLLLLYVTFEATRDAVIDQRKIGEAQTRAMIDVAEVTIGNFFLNGKVRMNSEKKVAVPINVKIENLGRSVAYDVEIVVRAFFGDAGVDTATPPRKLGSKRRLESC